MVQPAAFKFFLPLLPLYLYIIAITGDVDKRKRCIELGMVHFIEQPVGIQRIRNSIDSLFLSPETAGS